MKFLKNTNLTFYCKTADLQKDLFIGNDAFSNMIQDLS